jgi:predicted nucleotidyltransferase
MTDILLNFSQRPDLQPLAEIIADVQAAAARANAQVMIIGACARDLHLAYGLGVNTGRATEVVASPSLGGRSPAS